MICNPDTQRIPRRRTRLCKWCEHDIEPNLKLRRKRDKQHDLCRKCFAKARRIGRQRWFEMARLRFAAGGPEKHRPGSRCAGAEIGKVPAI